MPEHKIRLRGPWEAVDLDAPSGEPFRLSLPIDRLDGDAPRRLRLVRRFGCPRSAESLRLTLENVEGLESVSVNDEPLTWRADDSGALVVDLPPLGERNTLRLEAVIEPGIPEGAPAWGKVAIVIPEDG